MKTVLFGILVLYASNMPAAEKPAASSDDKLPRVLIIGDSISNGYTPYVIETLKGVALVEHHRGNAGPTIRGRHSLDQWVGSTKWDVIHFNWGLWDMYGWRYEKHKRTPRDYERRLDALVLRLAKTEAKLIWGTTTPICPKAEKKAKVTIDPLLERKYLDAAMRVMKKHNVQVNDLHSQIAPQRAKYALGDNDVHYTADGYKLLAKHVADQIRLALSGDKMSTSSDDKSPSSDTKAPARAQP